MSTIRDRRKHQNRVEAIAEALDSNHDTTTSAPHAVTSAGVSSAENTADSESLSEDNSTDQDLDLHKGADGHNLPLCSRCNDIKDIFNFKKGIPARSWRTLELSARVYDLYSSYTSEPWEYREHFWKVTRHVSKTCPFCSFLMDCASRMAIHSADAVDLESNDWFLALAARKLTYGIRRAIPLSKSYYMEGGSTSILKLKLCRNGETQNPFKSCDRAMDWKDTHLILPVQAYDDRHSEISDTIDWELIKEWLDMCQEGHDDGYCNDLATTPREDIPNFCVIDCETEMIIPAAEISHPDYVTLSYVWGASTTSPQVLDAITSLPVLPDSNQRPNVVNDAMKAVQRIGYRYLWVDRYCIPQSDHDAKSIQIKNMGRIYSMSVLTIIAAAGNDAEYGLPGVRSRPTVQPLWTTVRRGNSAIPVIYFEPPHQDILGSTWNSRGWTYQEALLSRKRLVFTDRHVYFQCESIQSIRTLGYWADKAIGLEKLYPYMAKECEVFPYRMS